MQHNHDVLICDVCVGIVESVTEIVKESMAIEEIQAFIRSICLSLPYSMKKSCNKIADEYVPFIIYLIEKRMDPVMICTKLGFCKSANKFRINQIFFAIFL